MRPSLLLITVAALALLPSGALANGGLGSVDWSDVCAAAKKQAPPDEDQPKKEDLTRLQGCDAEALYYGIGAPPDYEKARMCAYAQVAAEDDTIIFGGNAILMMIYANGEGVKTNYVLAERFACGTQGVGAEIDDRLERLEAAKVGEVELKHLDLCDFIASASLRRFCRIHQARMAPKPSPKPVSRPVRGSKRPPIS